MALPKLTWFVSCQNLHVSSIYEVTAFPLAIAFISFFICAYRRSVFDNDQLAYATGLFFWIRAALKLYSQTSLWIVICEDWLSSD